MNLNAWRNKIRHYLIVDHDGKLLSAAAQRWFECYKDWERKDTFVGAFSEGRMTARVGQHKKSVSLNVTKLAAKPKQVKPPGSGARGLRKTGRPLMRMGGLASSVSRNVGSKILLDQGTTGMRKRLDPKNFEAGMKNKLGLHDLSAVMLNPNLPLLGQLYQKGASATDEIILMPLPMPEDLRVFDSLAQEAKEERDGPLHEIYKTLSRRMTRIQLGEVYDMSSGLATIDKGDDKEHVRYGVASLVGNAFGKKVIADRRQKALDYIEKISTVPVQNSGNNEVIVKYREHVGMFPLVAKVTEDGILASNAKRQQFLLGDDGTCAEII